MTQRTHEPTDMAKLRSTPTREYAIDLLSRAAVFVEQQNNCPAEILFAQSAVESNWLEQAPGNNCLGYKDYPGSFGRQLLRTTEWLTDEQKQQFLSVPGREILSLEIRGQDGRNLYSVRDWFAIFPSIESCMARRAERWQRGSKLPWVMAYYTTTAARQPVDWPELFRQIALSGYATASAVMYSKACMSVLNYVGVRAALEQRRLELRMGVGKESGKA